MIKDDYYWLPILIAISMAITAILSRQNIYMVILLPAAIFLALIILNYRGWGLAIALIILPFFNSVFLNVRIADIPGAKITNILFLLILIGFLFTEKIDFTEIKPAALFYFGAMILFGIAVSRAGYVADYADIFWLEPYSPVKFFLSHGFIPILTTIPFLIIVVSVKNMERMQPITLMLAVSLIIFSAFVIIISVFFVESAGGSSYQITRITIGKYLGMHGNNIADFFVVSYPITLALALVPKIRFRFAYLAATALSIFGVAVIYSRAAYAIVGLATILVIFLTRKFLYFIPLVILIAATVLLVPNVAERAEYGFTAQSGSDISAGRIDNIWGPILVELKDDPVVFFLGKGKYGVIGLRAFTEARILNVTHAHNMYINQVLESGIFSLLFYLIFIAYVLQRVWQSFRMAKKNNLTTQMHLCIGLMVGTISFLIRGLSDGYLSPSFSSSYFYIVLALAYAIGNLGIQKKTATEGG